MKKDNFTVNELLKIQKIFKNKNWKIIETKEISHFNRYCKRIKQIKLEKERELILELTNNYLWIKENDYIEHLKIALHNLVKDKDINDKTKIYIMPLKSPTDESRTKSSDYIAYLFNNCELRYNFSQKIELISQKKIETCLNENNKIILAVDDFIGTGDTAKKFIENLLNKFKDLKIEDLAILTLVIQKQAIQNLKTKYPNIKIFRSIEKKKGISDKYSDTELSEKTKLMKHIEKNLNIPDEYSFGYEKSETLVTMIRTPNNTFPVFWYNKENESNAPFPRF